MSDERQFADVREHLSFLTGREKLASWLERVLGYEQVRGVFEEAAADGGNVFDEVAKKIGLEMEFIGWDEAVPKEGPVVVVGNHGHGGADAVAMMAKMTELRPDFRMLANEEVCLLAGVEEWIIPVKILGEERGGIENLGSLREVLRQVRRGGALGVFPAGKVALWQEGGMKDPEWNEHVISLLRKMRATIVPVWFYGGPPAGIRFLSRLSGLVRTALIPTGFMRSGGHRIVSRAGQPFDTEILREKGDGAGRWLRGELEKLREVGE